MRRDHRVRRPRPENVASGGVVREVHLALGSNLGDRVENLRAALSYLLRYGSVTAVSALYATTPVGVVEQPAFYNAACALQTRLALPDLLTAVKQIEWDLGRRRSLVWGPRPIDIDIVLAGRLRVDLPQLIVPHSRMAERAFVLAPLSDIAPGAVDPISGQTVARLLAALSEDERTSVTRIGGPQWAVEGQIAG